MKKILMLSVGLTAVSVIMQAQNGPTMGWSSWNAFGVNISLGHPHSEQQEIFSQINS